MIHEIICEIICEIISRMQSGSSGGRSATQARERCAQKSVEKTSDKTEFSGNERNVSRERINQTANSHFHEEMTDAGHTTRVSPK
jgi:hypothetical protein